MGATPCREAYCDDRGPGREEMVVVNQERYAVPPDAEGWSLAQDAARGDTRNRMRSSSPVRTPRSNRGKDPWLLAEPLRAEPRSTKWPAQAGPVTSEVTWKACMSARERNAAAKPGAERSRSCDTNRSCDMNMCEDLEDVVEEDIFYPPPRQIYHSQVAPVGTSEALYPKKAVR